MKLRKTMNDGIRLCAVLVCCMTSITMNAETIDVTTMRHAGPFALHKPFIVDSTDVNSHKFADTSLLNQPLSFNLLNDAATIQGNYTPQPQDDVSVEMLGFSIATTAYTDVLVKVDGVKHYQVYIDGRQTTFVKGEPTTRRVVVKYLVMPGEADTVKVSIDTQRPELVSIGDYTSKHDYNFMDVLHGTHFSGISVSPNGRFLIVNYSTVMPGGQTSSRTRVVDLTTGNTLREAASGIRWLPRSNRYYFLRTEADGRTLISVDPLSGQQQVMAHGVPSGSFTIAPTENFLIYTTSAEGPKEDSGVYQVIEPDDRQQGWRTRTNLAIYDLTTGMMQPLTYGHHNISLLDISDDGQQILFSKSESRLTQRPTTVSTIYCMNLKTMETRIIVDRDGFVAQALFSPVDGKQIVVTGSPEALGGIGRNVGEGQTPSMTDMQLYLYDGGQFRPLTKTFNPNVGRLQWSRADGNIYFTAEDRDSVNLFCLDMRTYKINKVSVPEEMVMSFSMSQSSPLMAFYGLSASNSDRLYTLDLKRRRATLLEDLSAETLKDARLGRCEPWTFVSSRGDTISCRYYLPASFDASKQYPMIVNYYGGCSPTSRNFESRYPQHAYASLGYVVLVVNPSGATGFGQEFSARHVNTAGRVVADDIIEATQTFCRQHSYVNSKKIGCIGASYGGFMTQYLQTVTDIFAAAISHAGISDHTSYWGEGYWGYSYSEVSMANSYPWSNPELYVDQSPLFRADKVHTPLLFLHGDADTNVPVGESIQMYTALKLLGRETAMVLVKDQNHHILDYQKRIRWQNTIFAWFAKYLQDDPEWWNSMYSEKDL